MSLYAAEYQLTEEAEKERTRCIFKVKDLSFPADAKGPFDVQVFEKNPIPWEVVSKDGHVIACCYEEDEAVYMAWLINKDLKERGMLNA